MKHENTFTLKSLVRGLFFIAIMFFATTANAQVLIGWDATGLADFGPNPRWIPVVRNYNYSTSGLTRGSGIGASGTAAGGCWGGSGGWAATGATSDNNSFHFTIVPNAGQKVSLNSLSTATRRSNSGPSGYTLYYSVGNGPFISLGSATTSSTSGTTGTINTTNLANIAALQDVEAGVTIKFRINPTGSTTGNFYLTGGANCLKVNGTIVAAVVTAPVATAATEVTTAGFTANWNAVTGAAGYRLDVSTDADFATVLEDYDNIAVTETSKVVVTGIQPNTTYYYRVRAEQGALVSVNSNVITVVIPACTNIPLPTATAQNICTAGTVANLTATGTGLKKWYSAATGGTALEPTVALQSGTYYVSQIIDNCESDRVAVTVVVNTVSAPVVAPIGVCVSGTIADITTTGFKWYAAATGGDALAPTVALASGNYYVSQTVNNCESPRVEVAVTINVTPAPTAAALTFCQSGTVANLTATGTGLKWYAAATGGDVLAPTVALASGNYYVSQTVNNCESPRVEVGVTINVTPAPTAAALTFCQSGTVANLTATGTDLKWYAAATGGDVLEATVALVSGNYYVSQTLNDCESTRTEVAVVINVTAAPTAAPLTFCQSGNVANLTATGTDLKWYAAANGGDVLEATVALASGNYYVSQTLNNCESPRTEVAVVVNVTAAPTAAALTFCQSGTVADLTGATTGTDLKWYAAATGGDVLEATVALASGNYYVSQTVNNCESPRAEVAVTIIVLEAPEGEAMQDFTEGETLADLEVETEDIVWYSDEALTLVIPETTVLVDGTVYYAVVSGGPCNSEALAITVNEVLDNASFDKQELSYYPNPVNDVLTIANTQTINAVTIYNIVGQSVKTKEVNATTVELDMAALPAGAYIVNVTSQGAVKTLKVIKK